MVEPFSYPKVIPLSYLLDGLVWRQACHWKIGNGIKQRISNFWQFYFEKSTIMYNMWGKTNRRTRRRSVIRERRTVNCWQDSTRALFGWRKCWRDVGNRESRCRCALSLSGSKDVKRAVVIVSLPLSLVFLEWRLPPVHTVFPWAAEFADAIPVITWTGQDGNCPWTILSRLSQNV